LIVVSTLSFLLVLNHPLQGMGIFLLGFLLNGIMADYKDAERIPADIVTTLETYEETASGLIHIFNKQFDLLEYKKLALTFINQVFAFLSTEEKDTIAVEHALFENLHKLTSIMPPFANGPAPPHVNIRLMTELHNLRRHMTRLEVISLTQYLPHGYALVELFVLMILLLVIMASYPTPAVQYSVIVTVPLIYVYLYILIADADDPFEYGPIGENVKAKRQTGSSEVDLVCMLLYRTRLRVAIAKMEAERKAIEDAALASGRGGVSAGVDGSSPRKTAWS
jgi:hypothetical protein